MTKDWNIEPYRFPDSTPSPAPAGRMATPAPPTPPEPEEPFRADLKQQTSARWALLARVMVVAALLSALLVTAGGIFIWHKYLRDIPPLPSREALYAIGRVPGIKFLDSNGAVIATRGPRYGDRVSLTQLPAHVPQAFLAAEDRRFYKHGPIDLYGIVRAAFVNVSRGRVVQGASTLSQQLAKGLFLTPDQTLKRKLQEAVMASRLEKMLSKDEVLELYLNRVFFGANTYGVDGASRTYFAKPANQLTLGEAALLAALPKAPSRLALTRGMPAALARSHLVLDRMRREGWITAAQEQAAIAAVPRLSPTAVQDEGDFGYAMDYATTEAVRIVGPDAPDLIVRLTVDPRLQAAAAAAVREVIAADGIRAGAHQGALVALSTDGAVRAMVGGTGHEDSPFNRAVQARRQPGSTFKPFVYAAALEKGILPTDIRVDAPIRFGDWAPENYGGGYRGPISVEMALVRSVNTIAVKLAREAGVGEVAALARRFGIASLPPRPDLSVALGSYEVNLLELVSAFQVFQQKGERAPPTIIETIHSVGGDSLYARAATVRTPVYEIGRASMMVKMMKKVVQIGTGTRAGFGRPAAGKTGTSQNWRDAWFVGFTPDYIAGVWVGNDDDKPMDKVAGGGLPATIWRRFMIIAHQGLPARDFDWLLPDPAQETEPDPRNSFYQALAGDFLHAAAEAGARAEPEPIAPVAPAPPPIELPY